MNKGGRPGLAAVLGKRAYRRLWLAQTVSRWGDAFATVALVVLVFRLTGSGLGVTGAVIAEILPVLLLAPVAGVVVDRLPRVRVMVAADLWRMGLASFAVSALVLARLRLPDHPLPASSGSWRGRVGEGVRLLVASRLLRLLALVQLLAALSAGATSALLVVLAGRRLGVGPGGFGLLLGAIGVGAAIGPLLLARLTSNPRRPGLVFGPLLLRGGVDLVLATVRSLPVALGALVGYGVGTSTGMVTYNALLQAEVPAGARGRVFAGFDLLWQAGRLASLALGGVAADVMGVQAVYALGGGLLLVAGTVGLAGLTRGGDGRLGRVRSPDGWR